MMSFICEVPFGHSYASSDQQMTHPILLQPLALAMCHSGKKQVAIKKNNEDNSTLIDIFSECRTCGKKFINDQYLNKHNQKRHANRICCKDDVIDCSNNKYCKQNSQKKNLHCGKMFSSAKSVDDNYDDHEVEEVVRESRSSVEDKISIHLRQTNKELKEELQTAVEGINQWIRNEFRSVKQQLEVPASCPMADHHEKAKESLKSLCLALTTQCSRTSEMFDKISKWEKDFQKTNQQGKWPDMSGDKLKTVPTKEYGGSESLKQQVYTQREPGRNEKICLPRQQYMSQNPLLQKKCQLRLQSAPHHKADFFLKNALKTIILFAHKDFILRTQRCDLLVHNNKPSPEMTEQQLNLSAGTLSFLIANELSLQPAFLTLLPSQKAIIAGNSLNTKNMGKLAAVQCDELYHNKSSNYRIPSSNPQQEPLSFETRMNLVDPKECTESINLPSYANYNYTVGSAKKSENCYQQDAYPLYTQPNHRPNTIYNLPQEAYFSRSAPDAPKNSILKSYEYSGRYADVPVSIGTYIHRGSMETKKPSKTHLYIKSIPRKLGPGGSWRRNLIMPCRWIWGKVRRNGFFTRTAKSADHKSNVMRQWNSPAIGIIRPENVSPSSSFHQRNLRNSDSYMHKTHQYTDSGSQSPDRQFSSIDNKHTPVQVSVATDSVRISSSYAAEGGFENQGHAAFTSISSATWSKNNPDRSKRSLVATQSPRNNKKNKCVSRCDRLAPPTVSPSPSPRRKHSDNSSKISATSPRKLYSPNHTQSPSVAPKKDNSPLQKPSVSHSHYTGLHNGMGNSSKKKLNYSPNHEKKNSANLLTSNHSEAPESISKVNHVVVSTHSYVSGEDSSSLVAAVEETYSVMSSPLMQSPVDWAF